MPELAEVYFYAQEWRGLVGKRITEVLLHSSKRCFRTMENPSDLEGLVGATLKEIQTHGKQMIFHFSGARYLGVHLGMTGKLFTKSNRYPPDKHDHLAIKTKAKTFVFKDSRMFGAIRYHQGKELPSWLSHLPTEILSKDFTADLFHSYVSRHQKQTLKGFLLLQNRFPGVGNWMADEILWRAQLLPDRRVSSLTQAELDCLYRKIVEVCRDAMRVIGKDWGTPPADWLFTHRWKDGGICPETEQPLARETIAGRTTCWSPHWQK